MLLFLLRLSAFLHLMLAKLHIQVANLLLEFLSFFHLCIRVHFVILPKLLKLLLRICDLLLQTFTVRIHIGILHVDCACTRICVSTDAAYCHSSFLLFIFCMQTVFNQSASKQYFGGLFLGLNRLVVNGIFFVVSSCYIFIEQASHSA